VNIVMHQGPSGVNVNPGHDIALGPGDSILVIAPMDRLLALERLNHPDPPTTAEPRPISLGAPPRPPRGVGGDADLRAIRESRRGSGTDPRP